MYTWKGRVCYDRPKRFFDWGAAHRIFLGVMLDDPNKEKDSADFLQFAGDFSRAIRSQVLGSERFWDGPLNIPLRLTGLVATLAADLFWVARRLPQKWRAALAGAIIPTLIVGLQRYVRENME